MNTNTATSPHRAELLICGCYAMPTSGEVVTACEQHRKRSYAVVKIVPKPTCPICHSPHVVDGVCRDCEETA